MKSNDIWGSRCPLSASQVEEVALLYLQIMVMDLDLAKELKSGSRIYPTTRTGITVCTVTATRTPQSKDSRRTPFLEIMGI